MLRAIVGLIKGLVVGGGVGFLLLRLGWTGAAVAYLACAVVGAAVGVVCGRAPWSSETLWTPVVKAIFGGIIGAGLCFLGQHVVPDLALPAVAGVSARSGDASFLAVLVGALYGVFVEVDDGGKPDGKAKGPSADAPAAKKKS